jgi:ribonuclease HI
MSKNQNLELMFENASNSPSPRVGSLSEAVIYCDGACSGNPGPGGWGTIVEQNGARRELSGGNPKTTNNQMEILAMIEGLKSVSPGTRVKIITDSEYVVKGATTWIKGWIRNGWKTASKQPVKNKELWQELYFLLQTRPHTIEWVKGHAGHAENERCDELARSAIATMRSN